MSDEKPLNVRCAMALGWRWVKHTNNANSMHPGERYMSALDTGEFAFFQTEADGTEPIYEGAYVDVPPFGAETTEGWACTGPLIKRFRLTIGEAAFHSAGHHVRGDEPTVYYAASILAGGSNAQAGTPCAAVAEWVAQFGAEAIKREVPRG